MPELTKAKVGMLEIDFVDASSMSSVLYALADIAFWKEEHLMTNWQDAVGAIRAWKSAANKLYGLADRLKAMGL